MTTHIRVATRQRLAGRVRTLRGIGWEPDELVREVTRASFDGTRFPAGALLSRLDGLVEAGPDELRDQRAETAARQTQRDQAQARRDVESEQYEQYEQERAETQRWTDALDAAMPPDELTELLELVIAEHHSELRGPAIMRHATARAWLQREYDEAGDGRPLPEFLAEQRAKLGADLDEPAAVQ